MANFLDARLLFGINLIALGLAATQVAHGAPGGESGIALLANYAVAVHDVPSTCLEAGLAKILGNFVLAFLGCHG